MSERLPNIERVEEKADEVLQDVIKRCNDGSISEEMFKAMLRLSEAAEECYTGILQMKGFPLSMLDGDSGLRKNIVRLLLKIHDIGLEELIELARSPEAQTNGSLKERMSTATDSLIDRTLQEKLRAQVAFLAGSKNNERGRIDLESLSDLTVEEYLVQQQISMFDLREAMESNGAPDFNVDLFFKSLTNMKLGDFKKTCDQTFGHFQSALERLSRSG